MSAALEMLFNTEQDEREELDRMLGEVGHRSAAEIDAFASELLGSLGKVQADRARYAEARKAEKARIDIRYDRIEAPLIAREALLEGAIKALAERQDFGSKKSRETANGTYGRRTKPAHIEIKDGLVLCAWAMEHAPALVTVERSVKQKAVSQWYAETGEEPPGTEFHAPTEVAYAKPDAK